MNVQARAWRTVPARLVRPSARLTLVALCLALIGCAASFPLLPPSARVLTPSPAVGWAPGGGSVRLDAADGMRFLAPVRVTFDGMPAEARAVDTDGLAIVAITPPHAAGAVDVRVIVAADTPYERRFTLPDAFTYVPAGAVTSVEPAFASSDGGTQIRVVGAAFQRDIAARVDGAPATMTRVSSEELLVTMPAHEPGVVDLALVNMPGSPIEHVLSPATVTYLTPEYAYHLLLTVRLVDASSGVILDSRLLHGSRPVVSPVDIAEEALVASLVADFVAELPLQLVDRDRDALWVADASSGEPSASARLLFDALMATLKGRGYSAERRRPAAFVDAAHGPRAFYPTPSLATPGAPSDVIDAKALMARVIVAEVIDRRRRRIWPNERPTPAEEWVARLPRRFRELSELAALAPVTAPVSTAMVVRSPVGDYGEAPSAWDYVTEDAIVAGLGARIRVVDKGDGPLVRPPWAMADVLGLPDGMAYSSWAQFRRANGQVESLLLYRPDETGFYARLVDTATGMALWSARTLPAREIFLGAAAETTYDRAEFLLETQPWYTWIPAGARVAIVALPARGVDRAEWRADAILAQDGLLSALTRAGVAVAEPMTALYSAAAPTRERVQHTDASHLADPWRELRLAGVTHILESTIDTGANSSPMQWRFRLLDAATGLSVGSFSAAEDAKEADGVSQ